MLDVKKRSGSIRLLECGKIAKNLAKLISSCAIAERDAVPLFDTEVLILVFRISGVKRRFGGGE